MIKHDDFNRLVEHAMQSTGWNRRKLNQIHFKARKTWYTGLDL